MKSEIRPPIFIVGTGRCGTMSMAVNLSTLPMVASYHEGVPISKWLPKKNLSHLIQSMSLTQKEEMWNRAALRQRAIVSEFNIDKVLVEAASYLSCNLHLVAELFPRARLIHLYRSAAEVVNSRLVRDKIRQNSKWPGKKPNPNRNQWTSWDDCKPWIRTNTAAEFLAHHWQVINTCIEKSTLARIIVKTENLSDAKEWDRILSFCGLDGKIPDIGVHHNALGKKNKPSGYIYEVCSKICTWRPIDGNLETA